MIYLWVMRDIINDFLDLALSKKRLSQKTFWTTIMSQKKMSRKDACYQNDHIAPSQRPSCIRFLLRRGKKWAYLLYTTASKRIPILRTWGVPKMALGVPQSKFQDHFTIQIPRVCGVVQCKMTSNWKLSCTVCICIFFSNIFISCSRYLQELHVYMSKGNWPISGLEKTGQIFIISQLQKYWYWRNYTGPQFLPALI